MTDQEMNRMTRLVAPVGALALAAAVALGTIAAMAQTPQPQGPGSPPLPGSKPPSAQDQPAASQPASPGSQNPGAAAKPDAAAPDGAKKTADIVGLQVIDSAGQVVGSVSKVEKLPSGEIRNVEISTGGFLGIGAKTLRVPGDKVQRSGEQVVLNLPPEQIKTMMQ